MLKEKQWIINSDRKKVFETSLEIRDYLIDQGVPPGEAKMSLRLAIDEAITNALVHGNKNDPGKKIEINLEISEKLVCIKVKDEGEGYNYASCRDPRKKENIFETNGRGIFLIRSYVDEVRFNQKGNEIIMIKHINTEKE